ncbi:MAG: hypothetical protein COB67_00390 [SAR324 cluster bacterium]|uniref:ATPase domain-containing protein n=1 Tax=SAR324 cluster bacterium TaxID=2024889 RepID=A0A2A4TDB5_9DELT|nr:MAG: hypothetical protein COB67_00390 [SAR324 cluster bacterium]
MRLKNPFRFDKEVAGEFFCGRKENIDDLIDYIFNQVNIIMFSKRRIGKSSLIKEVFANKLDKDILTAHIDIYAISTIKELYQHLKEGIEGCFTKHETGLDKLARIAEELRECFNDAEVKLVVGVKPSIEFNSTQKDYYRAIEDLLYGFYRYLIRNDLQAVIAIDEFQKIISLNESDKVEALLRTLVNKRENCSFIFTGSKRNLLLSLFDKSDRPFFKLGTTYPLDAIEKEAFFSWSKERFERKEIFLDKGAFDFLYNEADGETRFMQMISYELFKQGEKASVITLEIMRKCIKSILAKKKDLGALLDAYTTPQQNALKIIAKTNGNSIYEKEILNEYDVSKGTMQSSVKSLNAKGIIFEADGVIQFEDVEFKLWLKQL